MLLYLNHDALLNKGHISFDKYPQLFLNINETMNIRMKESQQHYMKWHRENKFK